MRTSFIAIGLALAGCETVPMPEPPLPSAQAPPARSAVLADHRETHVKPAAELQLAVTQGRLSDVRDIAAWFATSEVTEPTWRAYQDELRSTARPIARAPDLTTAGAQLGRFARACSACHQAIDVTPSFSTEPAPDDDGTLASQMRRHQWAAARLWEGIIGPSEQQWMRGARVLAANRLDITQVVHEVPNGDVVALAERLREQATIGTRLTEHAARAELYGEMMQTCTRCHSIVRPRPVVGAR